MRGGVLSFSRRWPAGHVLMCLWLGTLFIFEHGAPVQKCLLIYPSRSSQSPLWHLQKEREQRRRDAISRAGSRSSSQATPASSVWGQWRERSTPMRQGSRNRLLRGGWGNEACPCSLEH